VTTVLAHWDATRESGSDWQSTAAVTRVWNKANKVPPTLAKRQSDNAREVTEDKPWTWPKAAAAKTKTVVSGKRQRRAPPPASSTSRTDPAVRELRKNKRQDTAKVCSWFEACLTLAADPWPLFCS
jgi:hypothetical protein